MTVAALTASVKYIENGATLAFPVPFRFNAPTDLVVRRAVAKGTIVTLSYGADYAVTGGATDAGGTLTLETSIAGARLLIRRRTARTQSMSYTINDRFPASSHEEALDRQMLIAQEQDDQQSETSLRAIKVPEGEVAPELLPATSRSGQFFVGLPDGAIGGASGTGNDPDLRRDLASPEDDKGSRLTGHRSSIPSSPALIDLQKLGSRHADVRDWDHIDLNGNNDCASIIEAASSEVVQAKAILRAPAGEILCGRPVNMADGFVMEAHSHGYEGGSSYYTTILHFDHPGKGLVSSGSGAPVSLTNITTKRLQPPVIAGAPYIPISYDYDIYLPYINDARISRLTSIGSSKGVYFNGGRNNITDWLGQFFENRFRCDFSYDTCEHVGWHGWPVSLQFAEAQDAIDDHLIDIILGRCDNWFMSRIFSIWHRIGFFITNFAGSDDPRATHLGTAKKLKISQCDMDVGKTAYYVAADAVGHTADLSQFSGQGLNGPDGSPLIHILGPNTRIVGDFSGSRCGNVVRHEASAVGSKTSLRLKATDFDIGGNGFPAIEVLAGEAEILPGYEIDLSGGKKAGSGDISWPIKTKPYSGVADASGNVSIIHGIVAAQDKMQTAKAAYKGSSSEWRPCNIEYVDGDVVRVTGASPLALVRVSLSFIDQPDPTW